MISGIKSILVGITYEPAVEEVSHAFAYGLSLAKEIDAQLSVHAVRPGSRDRRSHEPHGFQNGRLGE